MRNLYLFKSLATFVVVALLFSGSLFAQAPTIASFSPASGVVGTPVTITGAHFNATATNNVVFFGSTMAAVTSASATSLTVTVPIGASYQNISVTDITTSLSAYSSKPFIVTSNNGSITYAAKADQTTGTNPWGVATGDIDGDGKADVVVTNYTSGTISVFRNTSTSGTVSFAAKVDYTAGTNPVCVAIGDLDGDGKLDVAVTNQGTTTVSVFRNTSTVGTINLATKVDFTTATTPFSVGIADLDGDGKPELIVANAGSASISIFRNTTNLGGGITASSFAAKADITTGSSPHGVAIGDLDGDGKLDIAVPNQNSNTMSVLRNTTTTVGTITFAAKVDYATGLTPNGIAIGDLDGDGKLDLAVTDYGAASVSVFLNTITASGTFSASSFATKADFTTGTNPRNVTIADMDGDGKLDLSVQNAGSNSVSILRNASTLGTINFLTKSDFTTGSLPENLAICDFDGDGKPDIAVSNYTSSTVSILRNTVAPATITAFSPVTGAIGTSVTLTGGKFNTVASNNIVFFGSAMATVTAVTSTTLTVTVPAGASYQNISVTDITSGLTAYSAKPFIVTYNNGVINYAAKVDETAGTNPWGIAVGDIDGDGKADIVVTNFTSNTISVFRNTSTTGSIGATSFAAKVDFTAGTNPVCVSIADIDADGKPDVVVTNQGANTVSVFRNTSTSGNISLAAKVDFTTATTPFSVAVADLDGDGRPDLAVANSGSASVSIFRNTTTLGGGISSGSFAAKVDVTTGSSPHGVAIGDFDGDGKPDMAVPNQNSSTVSVLRNTSTPGSIAFAAKVDFGTGTAPNGVAIGDIDGDGKLDIAVTNYTSSTVSVYLNAITATGTFNTTSFAAKADFVTGTNPRNVAITDLDGDGKLDLAVQNVNGNSVSVFRNTSTSGNLSLVAKNDFIVGSAPENLAIGDLDGDGKAEITVASYNANTISILHNAPAVYYSNATGDLSSLSSYGSLLDGTGAIPADFNGSGSNAAYQLANRTTYTLTTDLVIGSILNTPTAGTLDLAGQSLTVSALGGTGTLTGSNTSSLIVNGTIGSLVFSTGKEQLKTLSLGTGASLTLGSVLNIASTGTVNLAAGATLVTGGLLTLKSDISGSALVSAIDAGATVVGNVTVERYIADKRAWRLITSPVSSTQTINAAWQEGAANAASDPNPGYGTLMIGNSTSNGFDLAGTKSSLLVYDGSGTFAGAANTNVVTINSNPGYFLFSIGNRSISPAATTAHSATTLRSTGALIMGTQAATVNAAGFTLVGNPYAAPVDFSQLTRSATVPNSFYAWDINLGTYGGYVLVSNTGSGYTSVPASPSGLNNIIPSGAAVFVQSDGSTVGSLNFNESSKATGATAGSFSNFAITANIQHNLRLNLTDANTNLVDGVMASFADDFSNKVDSKDALKMTNFYENMALKRAGKLLTIERRSNIAAKDTIFVQLTGMNQADYKLQIDPAAFNAQGTDAYLEDAYLKTHTKLDLNNLSTIAFTATTDTASYKNRFSITFVNTSLTDPLKISHAGASVIAYPNPAANKQVNLSFDGLPTGTYNITMMDSFGRVMQRNNMVYNGTVTSKLLDANYITGVYTVNIQSAGFNQSIKVIIP